MLYHLHSFHKTNKNEDVLIMAKTINITDRLSSVQPTIKIGEKEYPVNDSMEAVMKFEELTGSGNKGVIKAMEFALGAKAVKEIGVEKMSVSNFKVVTTALLAAMQGVSYEEAEERFQQKGDA